MNMPSSPLPKEVEEGRQWSANYIRKNENQVEKGPLAWWYRISAPPPIPLTASLKEREAYRRGRLASLVLLALLLLIGGIAFPAELPVGGLTSAVLLGFITCLVILAIWLNSRGHVIAAGIIAVIAPTLSLDIIITLLQPHGLLSIGSANLYDAVVQIELIAVSLLPARAVFFSAGYNIAFVLVDFKLQPHSHDLDQLIATSGPDAIMRPIGLYLIVAFISYLWVRSATQAIARADRAETIALLERDLAKQANFIVQQKRRLDASIEQIMNIHVRVANGDLNARVPLTNDNVLWQIAGSLNNLLSRLQHLHLVENKMQELQARLQRAHIIEHELARTKREAIKQGEMLLKAKYEQRPIHTAPTRTAIDPILATLNGSYLQSAPSRLHEREQRSNSSESRTSGALPNLSQTGDSLPNLTPTREPERKHIPKW